MQGVHAIVRVLFASFFFLYFFKSQEAAISLAQHLLSGGQTTYHPLIGSCVLTAILMGIQYAVCKYSNIPDRFYVLTFMPSVACAILPLFILPSLHTGILILSAACGLLWIILEVVFHISSEKSRETDSPAMIPNLLFSLVMAVFLGAAGCSNDVMNYEVQAARYISDGKYKETLEVGKKSLATSHILTALRAYAMSCLPEGMGHYLFEFPLPSGGSRMLYFSAADSSKTLFPIDSLSFLQTTGLQELHPDSSFTSNQRRAADYRLCGYLLDKQLDRFVAELKRYYVISDSTVLPKYYEQALVLHERLNIHENHADYINPSVRANYLDFKEKESKYSDPVERSNRLRREYGDTYWWYYFYH